GFNKDGELELQIPYNLSELDFAGKQAYWIRCRYSYLDPDMKKPGQDDWEMPQEYVASPRIMEIEASIVGGMARGGNSTTVKDEELGLSDGTPGQVFQLRYHPLVPLHDRYAIELAIGP